MVRCWVKFAPFSMKMTPAVKTGVARLIKDSDMGRAFQNRKESMAKTADAKTKVYSKYGREIYVVAKAGGSDPNGNLALRGLIERAKKRSGSLARY